MKRIAMGLVWFIVFWIGGAACLGAVVGVLAQQQVAAPSDPAKAIQQGYAIGHDAGAKFGRKYGGYIFLGALLLAVSGTAFGVLPGTGRTRPADDE